MQLPETEDGAKVIEVTKLFIVEPLHGPRYEIIQTEGTISQREGFVSKFVTYGGHRVPFVNDAFNLRAFEYATVERDGERSTWSIGVNVTFRYAFNGERILLKIQARWKDPRVGDIVVDSNEYADLPPVPAYDYSTQPDERV